jgi:hypothetical protein
MCLQTHLIPTISLIKNLSILLSYKEPSNPPLHHLVNSYSQRLTLSKLFKCKWHLLNLVTNPTWNFFLLVSIWELTVPNICLAKKSIVGNMVSCCLHHSKGHYQSLASTKYLQNINNSQLTRFLCKFINVDHHLKNVQVVIFINFINIRTFNLKQWMQMMI